MQPVPIPSRMSIQGAKKKTIKGGNTGASDVEAYVGVNDFTNDKGEKIGELPFFAMLIEVDEIDMRHLHLDNHFWMIQYGPRLHPFAFDPAFISPVLEGMDPVIKGLQEIGDLLAKAFHEAGQPEVNDSALRARLSEIEALTRKLQLLSGGIAR
jgi:hypothetical protein